MIEQKDSLPLPYLFQRTDSIFTSIRDKMYFGSTEISIAIHHDAASLTQNPERERERDPPIGIIERSEIYD